MLLNTTFNKRYDLRNLVTNLQIYDSLSCEQESSKNVRYPPAANIFTYLFLNVPHKHFAK